MDIESLLDVADDYAHLSSTFAVLMPSDGDTIDDTKPAPELEMATETGATIADDLPIDFFLSEHSASNIDDEDGVTHEVNTGSETLLRPVVQAVDANDTTSDAEHMATSHPSSTSTHTTGNVASAADLNKSPYYIGTLGSCCGHYLHHGGCRKKDYPGTSTCYGSPSVLCLEFQMGTCTTIKYLRHEGNLVHIIPSCLVALSDGECFDDACTQGHDNFQMRRDKEEERKAELVQCRRNDDEGIQSQLEILKCSMESGATQKQTVEGSAAAARLKNRRGHLISGQLKTDVEATLELHAKSVEEKGLHGFELQRVKHEIKTEKKAAELATHQKRTDDSTRKQLIMVQYAMNIKTTDKQRVFGARNACALQNKLATRYQGEDSIGGELREWVKAALERYTNTTEEQRLDDLSCQPKAGEETEDSTAAHSAHMKKTYHKATNELLRVVRLRTPPDLLQNDANEAASELRKMLGHTCAEQYIIVGPLRDEVEETLKLYDQ